MKNITKHTGTLTILGRLPGSYFGNPRYRLSVDGIECRTPPDAAIGYSVTNYDGRQVVATIGTFYGKTTLNTLKGV